MKRKTLGIPVRCTDFSNSSQVVSFFTPEGLLDALAKGAHREKNPFQGPFDLAVLYEVVSFERHSTNLSLLVEAEVLDGFRGLRRSWKRYVASCHLVEFLRTVVMPAEPSEALFDLTWTTLAEIAAAPDEGIASLLTRFDLRALRILGLFAPARTCLGCDRRWSGDDHPVFFSVREGGLLCEKCRRRPTPGKYLPGSTVRVLNRVAEEDWGDFVGKPDRGRAVLSGREVRDVVHRLRTNLLERELVLLKSTARWV